MRLLSKLLNKLSSKPKVGGLLLSDSSLQYLSLEDGTPATFSVRLPPGVLREGKIESPDKLLAYLRELYRQVSRGKPGQKFKVVASLPSAVIYTQSFNVPKINREKLEESARLNLQLISPIDPPKAYMGFQVIGETEDRYDLLGAFVEKDIVEKFKELLAAAGFDAFIFEFPILALSRAINHSLRLPPSPILVFSVSSDGLDLAIVKSGSVYFGYFRSWRSIQGEAREITRTAFDAAVTEEVKKVINFSMSRFKENISQALVVAPGFEQEVAGLITNNFGLKAAPLVFKEYSLTPSWYVVLGLALRGSRYGGEEEINLSGRSLRELVYEERLLSFIRFWRSIIIGAAVVIIVVFGGAATFLAKQSNLLNSRLKAFTAQIPPGEAAELQGRVTEFNSLVKEVARLRGSARPWHEILSRLKFLADQNRVTLEEFRSGSESGAVTFGGRAPSTAQVLQFKNVLLKEPNLTNVELPLAGITTLKDNSVRFSVSFEIKPQ